MASLEDLKASVRNAKPAHRSVMAAIPMMFLAFCFSIGGLAGVWWAGSYEYGYSAGEAEYSSTLWESELQEVSAKIDDDCKKDGLADTAQSNCDTIGAVRAFVFLEFFTVLPALACPVAWLFLQWREEKVDARTQQLHNALLLAAAAGSAIAFFWAFLAVVLASTMDFSHMSEEIGVGGGGFVVTILSMVLLFPPSAVLEVLAWKWSKQPSAADAPSVKSPASQTVGAGREQGEADA